MLIIICLLFLYMFCWRRASKFVSKYETGKNWEAEHVSSPFVSPSYCSSSTSSPTNNPARDYSEVQKKRFLYDNETALLVLGEGSQSRHFWKLIILKGQSTFYPCRSLLRTEENLTNQSELDFTLRGPFKHISYLSFKEINTLVKGYAKRWASKQKMCRHILVEQ